MGGAVALVVASAVALVTVRSRGEVPRAADVGRPGGTVVFGISSALPQELLPVIGEGYPLAGAYLEVRVLPGPYRLLPDYTLAYDTDLLTAEPTSELVGGRHVVTYRLNPAARWSDGHPIDVRDFAYSWRIQRSADPARGGCPLLGTTVGYDQVVSVTGSDGGRTVRVTLDPPYADWRSLFNQQLLPAHLMDRGEPKANCAVLKKGWPVEDGIPLSGGPWQLKASDVNAGKRTAVLTPNPAYWGRKPALDRLLFQEFPSDAGSVVKALAAGEIQVANPPPQLDLVDRLERLAPRIDTQVGFGLAFDQLTFNTANPHLRDRAVRQAIATALDRPALVRTVVGQIDARAQVLDNRLYVNTQPEYRATSGGRYQHGDPAAARALLERAGYRLGPDQVYARDGQRLALELMTTQSERLRTDAVDVIAAQLRPVGIKITPFPNPDIFGDRTRPTSLESGGYDIALFSWFSGPFVTGSREVYETRRGGRGLQNYTGGGNPEVDRLFDHLARQTDPAAEAEVANQIDELLWDDLNTLPLSQRPTLVAYDTDYLNIGPYAPSVGPAWNADEWAHRR